MKRYTIPNPEGGRMVIERVQRMVRVWTSKTNTPRRNPGHKRRERRELGLSARQQRIHDKAMRRNYGSDSPVAEPV